MDQSQRVAADLERVTYEMKKVIVGQDHMVERLVVSLLARGHILLEGLPGLAKTLAVSTLARTVGGSFSRLQFTPDLLPSDLIGTQIWRSSSETFDIEWGPVFSNLVLTDEINRAPAKVQSALLEVMGEGQVSIGGVTKEVPSPFLVLATQNPVESEGVYTLPEAQRDRFLMKVTVGYPSPADELEIVRRMGVRAPEADQIITLEQLESYQVMADNVFVDNAAAQYAVDLVMATREPELRGMPELAELLEFGVSPRATLGLISAGRALALLRGRTYVTTQDIFDVTKDVFRHRLVLTYEALAKELTVEDLMNRVLSIVRAGSVSPGSNFLQPTRPTAPAQTPTQASATPTSEAGKPPAETPTPLAEAGIKPAEEVPAPNPTDRINRTKPDSTSTQKPRLADRLKPSDKS